MRIKPQQLMNQLRAKFIDFNHMIPMLGLNNPLQMECFLMQLVDSIRRIEYVEFIRGKANDHTCADPHLDGFNPIKAAAWQRANGNFDEACWLTFLITQFSKNKFTGWQLVHDIYGGLGQFLWDWPTVSQNPGLLAAWINENQDLLRSRGKFGNHRKYESLKFEKTGVTILSYVDWVGADHDHAECFNSLDPESHESRDRFQLFYNSLNDIYRFGRTAKFDHVTMLGKLGLADVEPDSVYMHGASGPYAGGNLLFAGAETAGIPREQLNDQLSALEAHLELPFGMQILEDALCNWQKQPANYKYFSG